MRVAIAAVVTILCAAHARRIEAQQVADTGFVPTVPSPAYAFGTGPVVTVDAGHRNFHTLHDRYAPFGEILRADGYQVVVRVAAFGEAAMFSAQLAGPEQRPMGLNRPQARQNQQFLLNVAHWLSGLLGD